MTRDEVNIIRSYFSRSVDRYIERRRILIRASSQLRNSLGSDGASGRDRLNTGDSSNSLLDNGSEEAGEEQNIGAEATANEQGTDVESGDNSVGANSPSVTSNHVEGEEILQDRLRMEDEWMTTQVSGLYSYAFWSRRFADSITLRVHITLTGPILRVSNESQHQ